MVQYPNLYFIGGMRCGSTTIHNILNQHPEINMSSVKEPYYWNARYLKEIGSLKYDNFVKSGRYRTYEKYSTLFDFSNSSIKYFGESSHYLYNENLASLIKQNVPNAKIIICLRNPINRLKSEYGFLVEMKLVSDDLNTWIEGDLMNHGRVKKGLYYSSVKHYLETFGSENVHIVFFENMIKNQVEVATKLFEFLKLNPFNIQYTHREKNLNRKNIVRSIYLKHHGFLKKFIPKTIRLYFVNHVESKLKLINNNIENDKISPELLKKLQNYYDSDIEELSNLLGENCKLKWIQE